MTPRPAPKPARRSKQHLIHAAILREPGIHMSELQRELGLGWGTVAYHVRLLRARGRIAVHHAGREARLFPAGVSAERMAWISATHNPVHATILDRLVRNPGLRADDIACALGLSTNSTRRHLAALGGQGLVAWKGVHGRRYYVRPPESTAIGSFIAHVAESSGPEPATSPTRRYDGEASRDRILATVRASPGIHTSELTRVSGISWGNLAHHLRVLEQEGRLERAQFGARTCYFTPEVAPASRPLMVARRNVAMARILEVLASSPGLPVHDLAQASGLRPSAVARNLHQLVQEGLVPGERLTRTPESADGGLEPLGLLR